MSRPSLVSHPSPNHDARSGDAPIDMLVLHYTGMRDAKSALDRLCDPSAEVSAHYLIDEDGTTLALVPEELRAWHAGKAHWRGRTDINARSIGIELVNPGHEFGYRPFPPAQMAALADLCLGILSRHAIPPGNVVGHADIAPARKQDPGELFDWSWLASLGIGLWPEIGHRTPDALSAQAMLGRYGYDPGLDTKTVLTAFQRHFRPNLCDGKADSDTLGRLASLLEQTGR